MIVLGFDTATPSTAVGLRLPDGRTCSCAMTPAPGGRPGHATRLLGMADELLAEAGVELERRRPDRGGRRAGHVYGLRVGVATARGLAQSLSIEMVGVSSLRALAERRSLRCESDWMVLSVLDARRGEAFAAAYHAGEEAPIELTEPLALAATCAR